MADSSEHTLEPGNESSSLNLTNSSDTSDTGNNSAHSEFNNNSENSALENLLDSALDDFDIKLPELPQGAAGLKKKSSSKSKQDKEESTIKEVEDHLFNGHPDLQAQLEQLTAGAASAANFPEHFEDIMKVFQDSGQLPEPTPEELNEMLNKFAGMNLGDMANGGQNLDFMPFMQRIMQNLLSKEMLYPAMKDITSKYTVWLSENQASVSKEEFDNYKKQYSIMVTICEEFEKNHESSKDKEAQSFEKILVLMQKMQECGNPPKEIIGEAPMNLPFEEMVNNSDGAMPEQCSIM